MDATANVELIDASFSQSIQEEVSKTVSSARNDFMLAIVCRMSDLVIHYITFLGVEDRLCNWLLHYCASYV